MKHLNMPNVDLIRQQVEALIREYPELQDDDILKLDMLEGETTFVEALRVLECRRQDNAELVAGILVLIQQKKERLARLEYRDERLRELLLRLLQAAELRKIELPEATLSVRPKPPKVIITDDTLLPQDMWRIKREPSLSAIGTALKEGETVPGATLSNQPDTISIRTS